MRAELSVDTLVDRLLLEAVNPNEDDEYEIGNQYDRVGNEGDRYHVTPMHNLGSIAKQGLLPNTDGQFGYTFDSPGARQNSEGNVFYTARLHDAKKWARSVPKGLVYSKRAKEGKEPTPAVLRARDPDPDQFDVDGYGSHSEQASIEPMPAEKLDVWHSKAGWTPLAAHAPELWSKVRPGHLSLDAKPKGQMQLFPKELYNEAVNQIVDDLLDEASFVARPKGWEAGSDDVAKVSIPGHAYRGMTSAEYVATVGAGLGIKSRQDFSTPGEGTSFSSSFADAESYVNFGHTDPRKTGSPNYAVEVAHGDDLKQSQDGYFKAQEEIPSDRIRRRWRFDSVDGEVRASEL